MKRECQHDRLGPMTRCKVHRVEAADLQTLALFCELAEKGVRT